MTTKTRGLLLLALVIAMAATASTARAATGTRTFTFTYHQASALHTTTMFTMHLRMRVSYTNGAITSSHADCWVDNVFTATVQASVCTVGTEYRFGWGGNSQGGYYAQATATFAQCAFRFGCFNPAPLTLMGTATADGNFDGRWAA